MAHNRKRVAVLRDGSTDYPPVGVRRSGTIALPQPKSLRSGDAAKVVGAMIAKRLQESGTDLRKGEPMWHETGDGHGTMLIATDASLAAIGTEPDDGNAALAGTREAPSEEAAPNTRGPNRRPRPRRARRAKGPSRRR